MEQEPRWREVASGGDTTAAYFGKLFEFVEFGLGSGRNGCNVLIHCKAGANRAGAAGVACLMHLRDLDVDAATALAVACRPIVNPNGYLPVLLRALERTRRGRPPLAPRELEFELVTHFKFL